MHLQQDGLRLFSKREANISLKIEDLKIKHKFTKKRCLRTQWYYIPKNKSFKKLKILCQAIDTWLGFIVLFLYCFCTKTAILVLY